MQPGDLQSTRGFIEVTVAEIADRDRHISALALEVTTFAQRTRLTSFVLQRGVATLLWSCG